MNVTTGAYWTLYWNFTSYTGSRKDILAAVNIFVRLWCVIFCAPIIHYTQLKKNSQRYPDRYEQKLSFSHYRSRLNGYSLVSNKIIYLQLSGSNTFILSNNTILQKRWLRITSQYAWYFWITHIIGDSTRNSEIYIIIS